MSLTVLLAFSTQFPPTGTGTPTDGRTPSERGLDRTGSGTLPAGVTPFDDGYAGVANLDPDLLRAIQSAAGDAADAGVTLQINSGWRSIADQERLRRDAVAKYGSQEEAARWVAAPTASQHVAGRAVDIGPPSAAGWLARHGAEFGLCRVYDNEPWHFELRTSAGQRCPDTYADPTDDPRLDTSELDHS